MDGIDIHTIYYHNNKQEIQFIKFLLRSLSTFLYHFLCHGVVVDVAFVELRPLNQISFSFTKNVMLLDYVNQTNEV